MFQYEIKRENQKANVLLEGSLSLRDTPKLKADIKTLIDTPEIQELVFDFKNLSYLDSSGIGILLHTYSWTKEKNKLVRIIHLSEEVRTIFTVANLLDIFQLKEET
ncbi:STAS domain-containing protein [Leptospira kanakyensis]|uniref:Anti-sigma factor antagonist n=1 Tax=Leptospira kanakyensis TaxID=2484968 RepID=A0A6N4Q6M4_9LEPT|nr:STAS domain-containing protein [Leptospira kanakyensis]MCW7470330.1 STAS domain-containing protein [Leptospira kanakyensis]MCW7481420.1 STAS domain-containing protein [Leptospira kanakyensis]TGK54037.1 anti-sigma factor antagonist [Leptospira kanakyensis]TGK57832.1 anti-sigma factor antagonist [Leptospira kanakyensis]TGK73541.1 anti-sigma factor antagonist [Leptospira kanakyensis]